MDKKKLILLGAIAAIVLTVASFLMRGGEERVHINRGDAEAFGLGLAAETAKLVSDQGQVLILGREPNPAKNPMATARLEALQAALAKRAGMKVVAVETIKVDALASMGGSPAGFLAKEFLGVSEKYPGVTEIISLSGAPQFSTDEMAQMARKNLKCVVVAQSEGALKELFQSNVVHVAILPRLNAPAVGPESVSNPQEWFAQHYQVIVAPGPQ